MWLSESSNENRPGWLFVPVVRHARLAQRGLQVVTVGFLAAQAIGQSCPPTVIDAPDAEARQFGWCMANVGDVDADGFDDFAVGDPIGGPAYAGRVHVYSGRNLSVIHLLSSPSPVRRFGESVAGAGDMNGDGHADILVGIEGDATVQGHVQVYSGRTGFLIANLSNDVRSGRFGSSVAMLGDVNGDGHSDFVVGARIGLRAYVYSGRDFTLLYTLDEQEPGESFAFSVSGIGDVNGDDRPDVLVSAPGNNYLGPNTGRVYVFSGSDGAPLGHVDGPREGSRFGESIANLGDVDGDHADDFIAGAHGYMNSRGRIAIVSGATLDILLEVDGDSDSHFGHSVAAAGDIDGDLRCDLLVGAPRARDNSGRTVGGVHLIGSDGTPLRSEISSGGHTEFGKAVAGGLHFDADSIPDFVASAPSNGFGAAAFAYSSDCALRLSVSASCPEGGAIQVSWTHATPDSIIAILYARRTGAYEIPPGRPCEGVILGLGSERLQVVFLGSSGPEGRRTLHGVTGADACGGLLQLLDTASCLPSNVVAIE